MYEIYQAPRTTFKSGWEHLQFVSRKQ